MFPSPSLLVLSLRLEDGRRRITKGRQKKEQRQLGKNENTSLQAGKVTVPRRKSVMVVLHHLVVSTQGKHGVSSRDGSEESSIWVFPQRPFPDLTEHNVPTCLVHRKVRPSVHQSKWSTELTPHGTCLVILQVNCSSILSNWKAESFDERRKWDELWVLVF